MNQPNQQTHPAPEVHVNKAYCSKTFVQAANSGPHKQGHGTIKAVELRDQKGLVLQGSPKTNSFSPWT